MATTILVVDDDPDIRDSMRLVLDSEGYHCFGAANGEEAIRVLQTTPDIDLILLDMMMPVMDGIEFRRAQLDIPALAPVPIIVVSGGGHVREKAEALGAVGYLMKPFEIDDLLNAAAAH